MKQQINMVSKKEQDKQDKVERLYNSAAYNWAFNRAVESIEQIATRNEPLDTAFLQLDYKNLPQSLILLYNSMIALLASEMIAERTKDIIKTNDILND